MGRPVSDEEIDEKERRQRAVESQRASSTSLRQNCRKTTQVGNMRQGRPCSRLVLLLNFNHATIPHLPVFECLHGVCNTLLRHWPCLDLGSHPVPGSKVHHGLHFITVAACRPNNAQAANHKWEEGECWCVKADGKRVNLTALGHDGHEAKTICQQMRWRHTPVHWGVCLTHNARSGVVLVVISKWSIGLISFKSFKPDVAWNSLAPNFSASAFLLSVVEKMTVSYPIFEAN